ncbi:hypothetical protein K458DRAFT_397573 [Lentithecium fluviatile CBS 122367]|uniref:Uncharacterized protein n=1 Tax=Lentithecium fluviatile CBS 122367 TaxID=1168545 RepID=A0A6G1ICP9_9PLEO|nr:hypothetical protein K458DRAFT_397573 [Lentithecium fluviatile CBS 122367]
MAEKERADAKKDDPVDLTPAWLDHVKRLLLPRSNEARQFSANKSSHSVLKSRDYAIEQMKENRRKVEQLDKEYREMAIRNGYILKEMQNSMTIYSQLLCRPFCDQIHKALPRELRNHIYGYLLGPRPEKPVPRTVLIKQRRREIWFSESWVGRQFTIEICEMAYRTDNLQLCGSFNLADLLLLPEDNGVLPVAHIRSLVLRVDLSYKSCMARCCLPTQIPPPPPPFPPFSLTELKDSLEPLRKIECKQGFKLEIRICGYYGEARLLDALDAMKEILMQLKEDGMKICIARELYYRPSNRFPGDLMKYYEVERVEWEEICKAHRRKLKAEGVLLVPPSPPPPPPPPMNFAPPPPMPLPWNPAPALVTLPNPPMSTVAVAPPPALPVVVASTTSSEAASDIEESEGESV